MVNNLDFEPKSNNFVWRVIYSIVPLNVQSKLEVDVLGSVFAVVILGGLLEYGYNVKMQSMEMSPAMSLLLYMLSIPLFTYILLLSEHSQVSLKQVVTLISYSLYAHIITIGLSMCSTHDEVNLSFFLLFLVFGGASSVRLILVFMFIVRRPAVRLLVSSVVCTCHLLFLLFSFFAYIHTTFQTNIEH